MRMRLPLVLAVAGLGAMFGTWFYLLEAEAGCSAHVLSDVVVHVRDGDTIVVGKIPVRLQGLAAPDRNQPGYEAATAAMEGLVLGKPVECELDGSKSYDRCAGMCYRHGNDIAELMVLAGLARDCPRYSGGRYGEAEDKAAAAGATIRDRYPLPTYCEG